MHCDATYQYNVYVMSSMQCGARCISYAMCKALYERNALCEPNALCEGNALCERDDLSERDALCELYEIQVHLYQGVCGTYKTRNEH